MCERKHGREPEAALIPRAQEGDVEAFDELYERHRRKVFAYAVGLLDDRGLAEDVVQDCFIALARGIGRIDARRGVSAWLWRVARNRAIDLLRRRRFEVRPGERDVREESPRLHTDVGQKTPAETMIAKEQRLIAKRMLDLLPPAERDLVLLRFYGGLKFREIARVVRRPLGTVLWQVRRSLEKIREHIQVAGDEAGGATQADGNTGRAGREV